ncbi:MAG: lipid-A-disaccharide synthase, partial [Prosthecochloris sp.]|uniref:lipid-A-disaccharide synthase n=1 Tax=Prosthecochloris sp. TaxID=290513 RepID=UPI002583726E
MKQKKLFVLAGEVSGDLHASGVLDALRNQYPDLDVFGTGGVKLRSLGARLLYDTDDLSVMGFVEVLRQAFFLRKVIGDLKDSVLREKPDVALLVDYPAMNLHMARFLKRNAIPVVYYISPKVWAWKEGRVMKMKRSIDRLLVIFNFEVEFFARHGMVAEYAGNPVVEELLHLDMQPRKQFLRRHAINDGSVLIGLLPGSRKQEISKMLSVMLKMAPKFPDHQFVIAGAPGQEMSFYQKFISEENIAIVTNKTYDLLSVSTAALVTSGTATLETALFKVPEVVCYKGNEISYQIGKRLVNVKYISLVNLILDKEVVTELIQE